MNGLPVFFFGAAVSVACVVVFGLVLLALAIYQHKER